MAHPVCFNIYLLTHIHTHCHFMALCPGLPGWTSTETFTHSHTKSSSVLYQPPPSAMIHSILPAQTMCFTVSSYNLYSSPLRLNLSLEPSTTYSIHFFTQSLSSFRNTCPYNRSLLVVVSRLCHLFLASLSTLYLEHFCGMYPAGGTTKFKFDFTL